MGDHHEARTTVAVLRARAISGRRIHAAKDSDDEAQCGEEASQAPRPGSP